MHEIILSYNMYDQFVLNLRGLSDEILLIKGNKFDEIDSYKEWIETNNFTALEWLFLLKSILHYFFASKKDSYKFSSQALQYEEGAVGMIVVPETFFFNSLAIVHLMNDASPEEKDKYSEELKKNQSRMKVWSDNCEGNYGSKYWIIEAEFERIAGNTLKAIENYSRAIDLAEKHALLKEEAIANELAYSFWLSLNKTQYANLHLKEAYRLYNKWGCTPKVNQIEKIHPELFQDKQRETLESTESVEKTITANITSTLKTNATTTLSQNLDLTAIIRASQAISGEMEFEKLMNKFTQILIENAGAERVILVSNDNGKLVLEAEGTENFKQVFNENVILLENAKDKLPVSIIQFVARTKSEIVLSDASSETQHTKDEYIKSKKIKSLLCSPVMSKGKLTAIIYLENNITTGAFTKERIEILNTLAAQAAISIENSRLLTRVVSITKEKAKVATEMEIAEQIQTSLLVDKPVIQGYDVFPYMKTADEVGGDYYDVINDGERDWLVIGDVSGHGVTAGLIMMMVQTAIHTIISGNHDLRLEEKIRQVNHVVSENIKKMKLDKYMTLTLILKEGDDFYYAGLHQDILIYRSADKKIDRLETTGAWLGLIDFFDDFPVQKFTLESGDELLLYTDGVTEAVNKQTNQMLEVKGLSEFFAGVGQFSNKTIADNLLNLLKDYTTKDDVTFMLVRKN